MEATVKQFQQKFKRVKDDMDRREHLHARLVSQFRNASSIIGRLQLLQNPKNYGSLKNIDHIKISIFTKQTDSLQKIMLSMTKTLEELNGVVLFLAKTVRDAKEQVKGGSVKQLHLRIGVKPSIADCLEGLQILQEMYQSDVDDLQALERILVDQPNILKEEVQSIYDVIFAEEIC